MNVILKNIRKKKGEHQNDDWIDQVYSVLELKIGNRGMFYNKTNIGKYLHTSRIEDIRIVEYNMYVETENTVYVFDIL